MAPDPNRAGTSASTSAAKDDAVSKKKVENEDLVSSKAVHQNFTTSSTLMPVRLFLES